jgi:predicted HNH restriction endonuclease
MKAYRNNRTAEIARQTERNKEIKEFIHSLKTVCVFCGELERVCLEFHHKNPAEKEFNIAGGYGYSREHIQKEVAKCICVCANCHRKIHAGILLA